MRLLGKIITALAEILFLITLIGFMVFFLVIEGGLPHA